MVARSVIDLKMLFRFHKGDWNGFWALFADNLANMVILAGVLIGVFNFPPDVVYGRILPGLGVTLLFGLAIYAAMSARLARRTGNDHTTALPYGISTPVLFVFMFAIIGPVYFVTNDALLAYRVSLGAAFIGGLIEMSGAVVGPLLKRITPRAGMLGTLAGIAIVWIAAVPTAIIFENPMIGLPALFIVLLGLIGRFRLPLGAPAGLVAIGVGIAIGFLTGDSKISLADSAVHFPLPYVGDLWHGLKLFFERPDLLAIVIPISIYNFIETMNNVESAEAAGDRYDVRTCQVVDGLGTCIGSIFGSPFPTTVYIGHPAYKRLGARSGYALVVGMVFFVASMIGLIAFLRNLIPEAAVAPLLVFVGVVIAHQAFRATPKGHGVAVAFALLPHIADLLRKQIDATLIEILGPGGKTPQLLADLAHKQFVHLRGYTLLSEGAIITGLLWGAIVAFLVDGKLLPAAAFGLIAGVLAMTGLIHAETLQWNFSSIAGGYFLMAGLFVAFYGLKSKPGVVIGE